MCVGGLCNGPFPVLVGGRPSPWSMGPRTRSAAKAVDQGQACMYDVGALPPARGRGGQSPRSRTKALAWASQPWWAFVLGVDAMVRDPSSPAGSTWPWTGGALRAGGRRWRARAFFSSSFAAKKRRAGAHSKTGGCSLRAAPRDLNDSGRCKGRQAGRPSQAGPARHAANRSGGAASGCLHGRVRWVEWMEGWGLMQ